jgi:hypothetical protein
MLFGSSLIFNLEIEKINLDSLHNLVYINHYNEEVNAFVSSESAFIIYEGMTSSQYLKCFPE